VTVATPRLPPSQAESSEPLTLPARLSYNLVARHYDRWHWQEFWRRNEFPVVHKFLRALSRPRLVLDVGTGTGLYLQSFAAVGLSSVGIDISENMLGIAHDRCGGTAILVQADAVALPLRKRIADIALAARVLSHVQELPLALKEVARVLTIGGHFILTDVDPDHDYRATRIALAGRSIYIDTYKWPVEHVIAYAREVGLSFVRGRRITAKNLTWLPEDEAFKSIDRTGSRPISHVLLFRRVRS
jgi:ubiquinone/menaquinone biosynthesis C-methylase UbiE